METSITLHAWRQTLILSTIKCNFTPLSKCLHYWCHRIFFSIYCDHRGKEVWLKRRDEISLKKTKTLKDRSVLINWAHTHKHTEWNCFYYTSWHNLSQTSHQRISHSAVCLQWSRPMHSLNGTLFAREYNISTGLKQQKNTRLKMGLFVSVVTLMLCLNRHDCVTSCIWEEVVVFLGNVIEHTKLKKMWLMMIRLE